MKFLMFLLAFLFLFPFCQNTKVTSHSKRETTYRKQYWGTSDLETSWLKNIKNTIRISSNHYSDFVLDSEGNSYIASFATKKDQKDYIYLAKVSPQGEILWKINEDNHGRATAIAKDDEENIWVTGIYQGNLCFVNGLYVSPGAIGSGEWTPFLAKFDKDGRCIDMMVADGRAYSVNCHVNSKGMVIISGERGDYLNFGDKVLKKNDDQKNFIASFDENGNCTWLKSTNVIGNQMLSDEEGNFYITGSFHSTLRYDDLEITTSGNYDSDGYLLKIDPKGNGLWLKQFGNSGNLRHGYRSGEAGVEMVFDEKGQIMIATILEIPNEQIFSLSNEPAIHELALTIFDSNGSFISQKSIVKNIIDGAISVFIKGNRENYYLTTSVKSSCEIAGRVNHFENDRRNLLLQLDSSLKLLNVIYSKKEFDGAIRVGRIEENYLFLSGHFRDKMEIGAFSIESEDRHSLFLIKMEL